MKQTGGKEIEYFLKKRSHIKEKTERKTAASNINQMILIPTPLSLSLSFCIGFPEHRIQRLASLPHSLHPSSAKLHPSASTPSKNSLPESSLQVQTLGALTNSKNCQLTKTRAQLRDDFHSKRDTLAKSQMFQKLLPSLSHPSFDALIILLSDQEPICSLV